jgi:uncharacterized repeat protein (TIGR01451 family)
MLRLLSHERFQSHPIQLRRIVAERLFARLEDRTLFDAVAPFDFLVASPLADDFANEPFASAECTACDVTVPPTELANTQIFVEPPRQAIPEVDTRHEIVFLDAGVANAAAVFAELQNQHIEVVFISSDHDGLRQMANALAGRTGLTAIHIVSHGQSGELLLGNSRIGTDGLRSQHHLLAEIGKSLTADGDILLYGCEVADGTDGRGFLETFSSLTGADIGASDDLTGNWQHGADWQLEVEVGQVESDLIFDAEVQQLIDATLGLIDISAAVVSDGTPSFDLNNDPGNDSSPLNGIVRSHDVVNLDLFFNTDSNGATNPNFTVTLPDGMVWDFLPAQAAGDARSGIFDSVSGEPGGDMRTMVMYLPDIPGTITSSISVTARALGVANGTSINDIVFYGNSDENATSLQTSEDIDFTISSAASADLWLSLPQFRGTYTDVTGAEDGVVYSYSVGLLGSHPTRTGDDAIKGTAPLEQNIAFDLDLTGVSPGAVLFDWGPTIGVPVALDGIVRNFEFDGTNFPWYEWLRPSGTAGEHPTAANSNVDRSTPDSGDWTVTGSTTTAAGAVYSANIANADTAGVFFPSLDSAGRALPADERWLVSGAIHVWVPIDEVIAGEDGVLGTSDDDVLMVTPLISSFDPDDEFGVTSNFGAGTEDESNNTLTHTIVSSGIGGATKRNAELGRWTWIDGAAQWNAGDAVTSVGHQYDSLVSSGQNIGVLDLSGIVFGDKFDNSSTKIVPISTYPPESTDNPSQGQWSRAFVNGGGIDDWLQEGIDYIIEFGTGGVGGDPAGWTDWNSMGDATLADGETSTVWTTDPTDAALGGTADPVTGVRDSITKYRVRLLNPLAPGASVHVWVSMETTGHSTLDLANNPEGDIIANFVAATADFLQSDADPTNDWNTSDYDPASNLWYAEGSSSDIWTGDRLTIVEAAVRIDKEVIDIGSGSQFLAGGTATIRLDATVTIPGPDSGAPARDVWVTDLLPAGLTVVDGSSNLQVGDTYRQDPTDPDSELLTVEAVEYFDGTSWSSTWSFGATGIRYGFGDVPLNTGLPTIMFDVLLPFDAVNGESWTNTAFINSPDDASHADWRDASAGLVAVQVAALAAGKQVVTPLVPEDTTIIYELGIANVSTDRDLAFFDAIDILPYSGDFSGSSFSGSYTDIIVAGLDPAIDVYVTTALQTALDAQDGAVDGYADPGALTDTWYEGVGAGNWTFTLDDVIAGVAGAPTMSQITALRFVSDGSVNPQLTPGDSITWRIELTPDGNVGIPSDLYRNQFAARTDSAVLPLPVFSPVVTAAVVAPDIEIQKEICLDPADCDPTNDAHWGEETTVNVSSTGTYRIKVTNTGTADLDTVVSDVIPSGLVYVAGTAMASVGDASGFPPTWSLELPAGTSAYLTFDVTSASATTHTNQASATGSDQFGRVVNDSDPASITFINPIDLEVSKSDGGVSVAPGEAITYTINFANHGPSAATGVLLREVLPVNTTYNASGSTSGWIEITPGVFEFLLGPMANGDVGSVDFSVIVDSSLPSGFDTVSNTVTIADDGLSGTETNVGNNMATDTTPITLPSGTAPDYQITKDDGLTNVVPGQQITYSLTISNVGDRDGTGVVVSDTFPSDLLTNVVASDGGIVDVANGTVTWNIGNFAINDSRTFTVTAEVVSRLPANVDRITNLASIMDDGLQGIDPTPENNTADDIDTVTATPDYVILKDDGITTVHPGDSITYSISVTNAGNQTGTNLVVTDTFPADLLTSVVPDSGGIVDVVNGTVVWNIPQLAPGDSISLTVSAQLVAIAPVGRDTITNTVTVQDDGTNGDDPTLDNNRDDDVDTLDAAPDLVLTKTDGDVTAVLGEGVRFTLGYSNIGNQDATGVEIVESLPAGTTFDATNSTAGWIAVGTNEYRFDIGNLAVGESGQIDFAVVVDDAAAAGVLLNNTATIRDDGTNGTDLDLNNNTGTDETPVIAGTIEGFVYADGDDDASFDPEESPIGGVRIELTGIDLAGNTINRTINTDNNGYYLFDDLPPGDYTLRQIQPTNFADGADSSGTPGASVGNDVIQIALGGGESATENNFGEGALDLSTISKRYFLSSTSSGVYDDVAT